ncbi:hypothetical protein HPB47_009776 [Ixodes persulcatus]|uniref:Uncharacterized protein n=1 Tax=Ixodes persulcatus TaxID=34615 RepID=A0AC60P1J5_IXOPE|nr:hypothetical protein HPB47_009776 [Ixodes persulcatus]
MKEHAKPGSGKKEERLCLTQPEAGSTTPGPAQQTGKSSLVTNHNKPSTRRRRPPLPRLPEDDRKVVVRPSNLNLRMTTPGQLLKAICEQLNLPPQEIFAKDRLRINPYNNFFTISTPVKERADAYRSLPGVGHRADVCYRPKSQRCHRCGEEHPPPEEGEPPNCEAKCIICERPHVTGSRNCKHRFVEKRKKLQAKGPPTGDRRRQPRAALKIQNTVVAPTPQRKSVEGQVYLLPTPGRPRKKQLEKQEQRAQETSLLKRQQHLPERRQTDELGIQGLPGERWEARIGSTYSYTQIATNNAMDADANRGTLKRQASTDLDANAKRVAEASPNGEPQPKPKTTVTSQAPMRKDERFDQLEKDNQETKDSLRLVGETLRQILQRLTALDRLAALEATTIRLIRRIANRRRGVKENDLCRLVQAFVISRMTYVPPLSTIIQRRETQIEGLIRQAYKAALDELTEAHRRMQSSGSLAPMRVERPEKTGNNAAPLNAGTRKIPVQRRRRARAQALAKKFEGRTDVVYVDAAAYNPQKGEGQLVANATVPTNSSEIAEEAAIALALTNSQARRPWQFRQGPHISHLLRNSQELPENRQDGNGSGCRPHTSNPGNEAAHDKARGSIGRAVDDNSDVGLTGDGLNTYHEITQHYRLERLTFPPPHKNLTKEQELLWRQLQTKTLPNPAVLSHAYPDRFKPDCSKCGGKATVDHIFWDCPADPPPLSLQRLAHPGPWENLLLSSDLETQIQAVTRAQEVAASLH